MTKSGWLLIGVLCLLLWGGGGCASREARVEALLATDIPALTDNELETHYRRLNDLIARGGDTLSPAEIEALRNRRNAVRQDLGLRGLRP